MMLNQQDLQRIEGVSLNSLQPATQATYGAGLLTFHIFCDRKDIPEDLRAPVDDLVLKSFIAAMAGIYSATAITNYVSAVRAWHIIHGARWRAGGPEIEVIVKGAKQMAPTSTTCEKCEPMMVDYIVKLHTGLVDNISLDVTVFACLTSAFWSTVRPGELMVKNLTTFDPGLHVKRSDLGESVDRRGLKVTTIRVPRTKSNCTEGECLYWAKQEGDSDLEGALQHHLAFNNPETNFHLFSYRNKDRRMVPLTKTTFQRQVSEVAMAAKLQWLPGHSICIGSTLEYLLHSLPFDVMKVKGCWNSDAFHKYLWDHAKVLAPYMQAAPPDVHDQFIRIAIPPAHT